MHKLFSLSLYVYSTLIFSVNLVISLLPAAAYGQIEKPNDAPLPLSAAETALRFKVPDGFRVELVASEPLVREPSGVCWDEHGRLFVCELHGYNLEGQYDIEELNKSGQLDRVVQRIQADERHKRAAEAETFGTIRLLTDTDGDNRMDRSEIWADRLPPCLGICPARGGLIAACKSQILFLKDVDGDHQAEIKEVLFEGFQPGPLERSINCPQPGPDNWIYFGRGAGGGLITGKYLAKPVQLPNTDFRIKPDGTQIEPIVGSTGTMGFTFTESLDRFVISTNTPGNFVAPVLWRYLARNPDVAAPALQQNASSNQRVYPTSQPHPWRTRRAADPGFSKLYTDRYGIAESTPNGYFTSACSPMVYQDVALPGLHGQLLACEPAQNFVHRAIIQRDGSRLTLHRKSDEQQAEFLTCSDPWFHAISLAQTPDGSVFIVDFYREIIEDYSAIPRYLQQQYGLMAGQEHGRIWRLTHDQSPKTAPADMSQLNASQLAAEVASRHFWRRTTARRLLIERQMKEAAVDLVTILKSTTEPALFLNAMQTLDGLNALEPDHAWLAMKHADAGVRRQGLIYAERWIDSHPQLLDQLTRLASDPEPMVRLQCALSIGESRRAPLLPLLAQLAQQHGDEPWMQLAILSSLSQRGGQMLAYLLDRHSELEQATSLVEPLCMAIANRKDRDELSTALEKIAACSSDLLRARCLRGIRSSFKSAVSIDLTTGGRQAIHQLTESTHSEVRLPATQLLSLMRLETEEQRAARLAGLVKQMRDLQSDIETRLNAVAQLSLESDPQITRALLESIGSSTPQVREAILSSVMSRRDQASVLLDALDEKKVIASMLSAVQRNSLLESKDAKIRQRAQKLFGSLPGPNQETFASYAEALKQPRDPLRGEEIFRQRCGSCHQAHGIGVAVGPDLSAEFQRAEETILKDVLAPSETITAGYVTYVLATSAGQVVNGILASETPTSLTLLQAGGKPESILRKDVEELRATAVSLMPEDLIKSVSPQDLADVLAWLRRPPRNMLLVDDNQSLASSLNEGEGTAEFVLNDKRFGQFALRVTPPQRHSPRIAGWNFRIRENPGAGEYRYLRLAWKASEADGVMLELADSGRWPPANRPVRRYHAGRNTTKWQSTEVSASKPQEWTIVTRDLWKDFGDFTLTGIAPTAMGGAVLFDRIELLQEAPAAATAPSSDK